MHFTGSFACEKWNTLHSTILSSIANHIQPLTETTSHLTVLINCAGAASIQSTHPLHHFPALEAI